MVESNDMTEQHPPPSNQQPVTTQHNPLASVTINQQSSPQSTTIQQHPPSPPSTITQQDSSQPPATTPITQQQHPSPSPRPPQTITQEHPNPNLDATITINTDNNTSSTPITTNANHNQATSSTTTSTIQHQPPPPPINKPCLDLLKDIALKILENHETLLIENQDLIQRILGILAQTPSVFNEPEPHIWSIMKSITCSKVGSAAKESEAMQLLRKIWTEIVKKPKTQIDKILRGPPGPSRSANGGPTHPSRILFVAAEKGNIKFIVELIHKYPDLIWKVNDLEQTIFHIAISHRHENIYNLLYEIGLMKDLITPIKDSEENNMLHLVGTHVETSQLHIVSGVAFQMQRELFWFKEVESMIPIHHRERKNKDGLKPYELFTKNHKDMVSHGEMWMRETSNRCMVVAALIATIVFTVAFTIPGGYKQDEGWPVFLNNVPFLVFVVLDAISLILSTTSILVFLSILTSRFAQMDFLESLPKKLMVGLATLFLSIMTMMIAFSVSFFVLYRSKFIAVAIIISVLAVIPIISYAKLQYPLLMDVFLSTRHSTSLFRPKKRMLYYKDPRV